MRHSDELPLDPEVLAELEAIDATLAGRIVDPVHSELAELTIMLAADRPPVPDEVARRLDARLASALAPAARRPRPARRRRIVFGSAMGGSLAAAAAAVAAVAVLSSGPAGPAGTTINRPLAANGTTARSLASTPAAHAPATGVTAGPTSAAGSSGARSAAGPAAGPGAEAGAGAGAGASSGSAPPALDLGVAAPTAPAPVPNGRKVIQSAQLQLAAANDRVATVAEEVFTVVGQVNGIVQSSSVTSASANGGYATFALSIPSGNLQQAMTLLSNLRYATVASRTDATQDVNNRYNADVRALQDARALRTALLKQLATAYTEAEIQSLYARIHDAEASISSDEATLHGLEHQIGFSSLSVQINGGPVYEAPPATGSSTGSGGFTLGRAAHDALRVLTVAAGGVLIGLAALAPVALLLALIGWFAYAIRRRRREHALDAA